MNRISLPYVELVYFFLHFLNFCSWGSTCYILWGDVIFSVIKRNFHHLVMVSDATSRWCFFLYYFVTSYSESKLSCINRDVCSFLPWNDIINLHYWKRSDNIDVSGKPIGSKNVNGNVDKYSSNLSGRKRSVFIARARIIPLPYITRNSDKNSSNIERGT